MRWNAAMRSLKAETIAICAGAILFAFTVTTCGTGRSALTLAYVSSAAVVIAMWEKMKERYYIMEYQP
jgi:hypothetical protein